MTQPNIPVQPGETDVTAGLRQLAALMDWCVTHTTDGVHAIGSLHYSGRAVDLADRAGPGADTPALLHVAEQVIHLVPLSMISELIYAGPGNVCVHNGQIVDGLAVYGAATMAGHHNHVHLGVVPSFTYQGGSTPVPDDPNLPNITGPVQLEVLTDQAGNCTGYYIFSQKTGELHAFGPGTKFYGRSEVIS